MTQPNDTDAHAETPTKPKHMNPNKLRYTLYRLTIDWLHLHTQLPTPPRQQTLRHTKTHTYGHPAEWASDTAALIADMLTSWHDYLAEQRNETPPPHGNEQKRIIAAWKYLEPRCEQLTQLVTHDDLKELPDLHHRILRILGFSKAPKYILPVPCPSCGLLAMERTIGMGGNDYIACGNPDCTYIVRDDPDGKNYKWLIRVCLDTLIESEQQQAG